MMIVENPAVLRRREVAALAFLPAFLAVVLFPFAKMLSISFREGNFATGSLLPENPTLEHWALALGLDHTRDDGTVVSPPFPVLPWLWNSVDIGFVAAGGILMLSARQPTPSRASRSTAAGASWTGSPSSRCSPPRARSWRSTPSSTRWAA